MPTLSWIQVIAGAAAGAALSWLIGSAYVSHVEKEWAAKVEAQKTADAAQCNNDKQITKEANDALQKDRDTIARRLAALKLQAPAACVPVTGTANLYGGGPEHAGQNGISSDWLREYAAEAETYRSEVITCIKFINQERKE